MSKDELNAVNKSADQKNKKIIRDITDPKPGLFIDDKLNPNELKIKQITLLIFHPRYNSNLKKLPFKKNIKLPIIQPTSPEIITNVFPKTENFFIDDDEFYSSKKPEPTTIKLVNQKMRTAMT